MALLYTLNKIKDQMIVEVEQASTFVLKYISDSSNTKVQEGSLEADSPFTLNVTKDGKYSLTLSAEGENDIIQTFDSIKNIQNAVIRDAKVLLCDDCDCGCNDSLTADCLNKVAKKCLKHKSAFVRMMSYQYLGTPTYGGNYLSTFTEFVRLGIKTYNCKAQTSINNILAEACMTGNVKTTDKLFNLYLALYWAGMYFTDLDIAKTEEEIDFVKTKFAYEQINACLCSTCIDMDKLKELFDTNGLNVEIYSFQFDGTEYDINNIDLLDQTYLDTNGNPENETILMAGKEIEYTQLGRVGFVFKNTFPNKYRFLNALGVDITESTFDIVYDEVTLTEYYVSKEYYTPSTVYYKLLKV